MNRKRTFAIITLIPVLVVMLMIFLFSMQNSEQSSKMSSGITDFVVRILYPDFENMDDTYQTELYSDVHFVVRKAAHFSEYAALGLFTMLHVYTVSEKRRIGVLIAIPFSVVYAVLDEWHQSFVSGRVPAIFDVAVDSFGVIFGTLIMLCIISTVIAKKAKVKDYEK